MDLSIIIINFHTNSVTCDCLHSVKLHLADRIKYELILIDNASRASSEALFKGIMPDLIYLPFTTNLGFGLANNKGMGIAKGEYFLLLNSDTLIVDDSIQRCIYFMRQPENSKIGLLGCKLLNEDGSYQASFYPFINNNLRNYLISNNPLLSKLFSASRAFTEPPTATLVGDVSGAFMLLKREVYESTGGFDPDFFLYCEETEWCRNRISKQYEVVYYPHASIIHLGGKSAPGEIMYIQSQLSLALYWYKSGPIQYLLYALYNYANSLFFVLQYPFANAASRSNIRKFLESLLTIQRYLFFDIPRYKRSYNSRDAPLILDKARSLFFRSGQ